MITYLVLVAVFTGFFALVLAGIWLALWLEDNVSMWASMLFMCFMASLVLAGLVLAAAK